MKKLTAGIFTALLGLVTVNAANAAIPSTTYVDTKITTAQTAAQDYADTKDAALKTAIETAYEAADATTLSSAKAYTDDLKNGQVETNRLDIASMDTFVAPDVAMTVGNANPTTVTAAINALDARITEKTSGIASEGTVNELTEAVEGLKTTVSGHTTDISGLEGRMTTAEGDIGALEGLVGTTSVAAQIEAANNTQTTELQAYADQAEADAKAYADGLNTAADGRLDALEGQDITLNAAIEANTEAIESNTEAIESNDLDITALQNKDAELANSIATKADAAATTQALGTKADKDGYTASQVVVTDGTGTITTAAQIPNTQVSGLGDLATKSTIADADVAANAAIAQSKIAGLEDALANTTPKVTARGEAGTYVLTAIVSDSGATSYQWEQIERPTTGGEG